MIETVFPVEPGATTTRPGHAGAGPRASVARRDDQPILSIRAWVPAAEAEVFVATALRDIRAYLQEHHVAPAGPPFSLCWCRGDELDIEAGWPTPGPLAGTSRIHAGELPRSLTGPRARERS